MKLERGILQLSDIQGELFSGVARANLDISLVDEQSVLGTFQLRGMDASALAHYFHFPEVPRGSFHLSGELSGKLKTRKLNKTPSARNARMNPMVRELISRFMRLPPFGPTRPPNTRN